MAKIYLGDNDTNYNIVNNNTTIFGTTGTQSILIAAGLTGVKMDSAVEGATFAGNLGDYTFKQVGVSMQVYKAGTLVTTFDSPNQTPTFADGVLNIEYASGIMSMGGTTLVDGANPVSLTGSSTDINITSDTTAQAGVAENFIYAIDSSSGNTISQLTSDITLSGFTIGEDSLTFNDVTTGTVSTTSFVSSVVISTSSIDNQTDIIFDANSSGDAYQLTLAGLVDETLSTLNMTVA